MDHNRIDNRIENLEPLCYSCHAKEHKIRFNFPNNNMKGGIIMKNNILEFE